MINGNAKTESPKIRERRDVIAKLVNQFGYASNEFLADYFKVSTQTIRRDIQALSRENLVMRHHGGAGPASSVVNTSYDVRRVSQAEDKRRMAKAVSELLRGYQSFFINPGTTMEIVARELIGLDKICVITNSIHVAHMLHHQENIEVQVPCGLIRSKNGAIVGPSALEFLAYFHVDFLLMSTGCITPEGVLLDFDFNEAMLVKRMMRNARKVVLVADHTKFGRKATVKTGHVSEVDYFVTDRMPPSAIAEILRGGNVKSIVVEPMDGEEQEEPVEKA